jgi:ankyrin repeat protein
LLLSGGANVNAKNDDGKTPLDIAGAKDVMELLRNPPLKAQAPAGQIKETGQPPTALNPQTGQSGDHYWKWLGLSLLVAIGLAILAAFAIKFRSRWEAGGSQQPDRKTTPRPVNDPLPDASFDEWFYSDGEHSIGPFTKDRIRALYTAGVINDNTPLCKGEFEQWTSFKDSLICA